MPKKLTQEEFVEKASKVHGDKYDYSLVEYKNALTKVKIFCSEHGIFEQKPGNHLFGQGCSKCSNNIKPNIKEFIKKAKKIHGNKYDYSLVEYQNNHTKIKIICLKHGIFEQTPKKHITRKQGCSKCVGLRRLSTEEFIKKAMEIHGNKYDYSKVEYKNSKIKIKILCPKHGEFLQTPNDHFSGYGCPVCNYSKGEIKLSLLFKENKINFTPQKKFEGCKNKNKLPFDFYLNNYNTCIEFHGIQHFKQIDYFGDKKKFIENCKRDKIKEEYCKKNNIPLIIVFNKKTKYKNIFFVDLFNNSPSYIKDIMKKLNNIQKIYIEDYESFKSSF